MEFFKIRHDFYNLKTESNEVNPRISEKQSKLLINAFY